MTGREREIESERERERELGHLNLFSAEADILLRTAQSSQGTVKLFYQILSITTEVHNGLGNEFGDHRP